MGDSKGLFPLLSKDEVIHSPSFYDGMKPRTEDQLRRESVRWIVKTGESLKMPQFTIATACVYFHRFYSRYSFKAYDRRVVTCACIFLAGKAEESRKKLDEVIDYFNYTVITKKHGGPSRPKKNSQEFLQFKAKLLKMEIYLMEAIEFEFNVIHPYKYLVQYVRKLFPGEKNSKVYLNGDKGLAQFAWFFVNDSLRSTLCLTNTSEQIAVAAIFLALRYKEIDYDTLQNTKRPWYEEFNMTLKELDEMGEKILYTYDDSKKRRSHPHGTKVKMSREEHERYKKMSNEEKKRFLYKKSLERMTPEERARYAARKKRAKSSSNPQASSSSNRHSSNAARDNASRKRARAQPAQNAKDPSASNNSEVARKNGGHTQKKQKRETAGKGTDDLKSRQDVSSDVKSEANGPEESKTSHPKRSDAELKESAVPSKPLKAKSQVQPNGDGSSTEIRGKEENVNNGNSEQPNKGNGELRPMDPTGNDSIPSLESSK
mmetsp:Transcript_31133/g.75920  ORF Transcript_31133/g.75920 Transcript_31133/m.75920 type:complete len:487 (-) Transcript_31133:140-1600(-)|eukprot:CAMPEP_0114507150 /NCGR_PEP_ID=MMETSP0109-20121206/11850_1 /TAXON_ID=29199 /ORGANISM="Chlorarachnion reptans, Strain CCCM449" /LENGTH=486 /DNA_ID=CAMNT_0001685871 /DNA_START=199 /DNA_END=1659 /DNA_ORIENTATION=-